MPRVKLSGKINAVTLFPEKGRYAVRQVLDLIGGRQVVCTMTPEEARNIADVLNAKARAADMLNNR